jgi:hypothetical protein
MYPEQFLPILYRNLNFGKKQHENVRIHIYNFQITAVTHWANLVTLEGTDQNLEGMPQRVKCGFFQYDIFLHKGSRRQKSRHSHNYLGI